MPSTASPFGLMPIKHPSGTVRPVRRALLAAYAATINNNDPIKMAATGYVNIGATSGALLGSFQGVEFLDSAGVPRLRNFWVASTATYGSADPVCYVTEPQSTLYKVQSTAALSLTDVSSQANMASIGSTVSTGQSNATLDQSTLTASSTAQLRILELATDVGNAWGDTYTNVIVEIATHQYVATINAI